MEAGEIDYQNLNFTFSMLMIFTTLYHTYRLLYVTGHNRECKVNRVSKCRLNILYTKDFYYVISHLSTIILYRTNSNDK